MPTGMHASLDSIEMQQDISSEIVDLNEIND